MIMKNKIKEILPRTEVEIHLPDGRVLSGPRGATVKEFLAALEFDSQIVGAIVNGELRELTYAINMEARVEPVWVESADGTRIYRRSLTFLLEMAFTDLYPDGIFICRSFCRLGGVLLSGNRTQPVIRV